MDAEETPTDSVKVSAFVGRRSALFSIGPIECPLRVIRDFIQLREPTRKSQPTSRELVFLCIPGCVGFTRVQHREKAV